MNLARLYLSICSEVDVVAKMICEFTGQLPAKLKKKAYPDIRIYREIITGRWPKFGSIEVQIRP
jgi:hypothetical protein